MPPAIITVPVKGMRIKERDICSNRPWNVTVYLSLSIKPPGALKPSLWEKTNPPPALYSQVKTEKEILMEEGAKISELIVRLYKHMHDVPQ